MRIAGKREGLTQDSITWHHEHYISQHEYHRSHYEYPIQIHCIMRFLHSCWRSCCHIGKTTGEGNALDETEWEHGLGSNDQIISSAWCTWGYAGRRFYIGSFTSITITASDSATPYFVFLTSNIPPIRQIGRMCCFNNDSFSRVWVTYSAIYHQYSSRQLFQDDDPIHHDNT